MDQPAKTEASSPPPPLVEIVLYVDICAGFDPKTLIGFGRPGSEPVGGLKRYRISAWVPDPAGPYEHVQGTATPVEPGASNG